MDKRLERFGEFVVTRSDASELLDPAEETFDEVTVFVDMAIEISRIESVGARRNDRLAPLGHDGLNKCIRIVALSSRFPNLMAKAVSSIPFETIRPAPSPRAKG